MIDIDKLHFEAQNARVTKSLQQQGATSSLFSLYLAMQIDDTLLHDACSAHKVRDADVYESMYQEPIQNTEHLRARLYSVDLDYKRHRQYFSQISNSKDPSVYLHFFNSLMPQALHYSSEEKWLPDEIIENLSFASQQKYQPEVTGNASPHIDNEDKPSAYDGMYDYIHSAHQFCKQD